VLVFITSGLDVHFLVERCGVEASFGIARQQFNLTLDLVEFLIQRLDERDSTLEGIDRFFETQLSRIDLVDNRLEIFEFVFELLALRYHRVTYASRAVKRARSRPFRSRI